MAYTPLIKTEYNANKAILFTDISLTRKITAEGALKEMLNEDALAQAFKVWLTSAQNEKLRLKSGGWLIPHIGKPMNEERANMIKSSIETGIASDFIPALTIVTLEVIPNYEKAQWIIYIAAFNQDLNVGINTAVTINNGV